jgi:hypothetical protein
MGSGPVQIAYNRFQVGVVTDPRLYVYDRETLTFDEVIATEDNGFAGASALCVVNGTGVFIEPGGDRFNVTGLNDFSSINPTEVSTAESRSDPAGQLRHLGIVAVPAGRGHYRGLGQYRRWGFPVQQDAGHRPWACFP